MMTPDKFFRMLLLFFPLLISGQVHSSLVEIPDNPFIGAWVIHTENGCQETYFFSANKYLYSLSGQERNRRSYEVISKNKNTYELLIKDRKSNGLPDCEGETYQSTDAPSVDRVFVAINQQQDLISFHWSPGSEALIKDIKRADLKFDPQQFLFLKKPVVENNQ